MYGKKHNAQRATDRTSDAQPLKAALGTFVKLHNMQSKFDEVEVVNAWQACFGELIHSKTRRIALRHGGVLWVELESGPLKEEFVMSQTEVIKRLNEHLKREVVRSMVIH